MVSKFSASVAFGASFQTLQGPFGALIWPSGNAKPLSLVPLGRPRADPNFVVWAPKASKSRPRAPHTPLEASPWPTRPLQGLQEASKRPPGGLQGPLAAILAPFQINFEAISMRCCHHGGRALSLKATLPRARDPRPQACRNARERSNPAQRLWRASRFI